MRILKLLNIAVMQGLTRRLMILCCIFLVTSCNQQISINEFSTFVAPLGEPLAKSVLWSPVNQNEILVSAGYPDFSEKDIYIFDIETKEKKVIAQAERGILDAETWSPNGKQVILSAFQDTVGYEKGGLWKLDIGADKVVHFQNKPGNIIWGPGETQFIFDRLGKGVNGEKTNELVWMDSEKQTESVIFSTGLDNSVFGFSLSPDGEKLILSVGSSQPSMDHTDMFVLDLKSNQMTTILQGGDNKYPVWSPKGDYVVYINKRYDDLQATYSYYLINLTTSCKFILFESSLLLPPSWSPDGVHLVYIDYRAKGIFLFDVKMFIESSEQARHCK